MVDTGIVQKLLELLDRHVEEGNVTVQHAALSALRNLAIPGEPPHQECHFDIYTGLLSPSNLTQDASLVGDNLYSN